MKLKTVSAKPVQTPTSAQARTPRVAAVRHIGTDRPLRAWSLLLPPNLERK